MWSTCTYAIACVNVLIFRRLFLRKINEFWLHAIYISTPSGQNIVTQIFFSIFSDLDFLNLWLNWWVIFIISSKTNSLLVTLRCFAGKVSHYDCVPKMDLFCIEIGFSNYSIYVFILYVSLNGICETRSLAYTKFSKFKLSQNS